MEHLPRPVLTLRARHFLEWQHDEVDLVRRALLTTVNGNRNVIELESVAKAMGLPASTLDDMRAQGLVNWDSTGERPS